MSGMMGAVPASDEEPDEFRSRLADRIRTRRLELGTSVRQAAQTAGIARNTWTGAEDGTRRTAEANYAAIERALRWAPGSINEIKTGGEPSALPAPPATPGIADEDTDDAIVRIMNLDIDDAEKARIIRIIVIEQERARQNIRAMVDKLIAETSD